MSRKIGSLARHSRLVLAGGGGGGGGPSGPSLSQVSTRLVWFDDFVRSNSETVGTPTVLGLGAGAWVEENLPLGADILGNALVLTSDLSGAVFIHRPNAEAVGIEMFTQARVQWTNATVPAFMGPYGTDAFAVRDGYNIRQDDSGNLLNIDELTNGSFASLGTAAFASGLNLDYIYELFTDTALQEAYIWRDNVAMAGITLARTDATQDAIDKRCIMACGSTAAGETITFDWAYECRGKTIDVSGLSAGDQIEVQLVSDDTVIIGATESSGSVSLDVSRFNGSLTEDGFWPAGDAVALKLVLIDSGSMVLDTLLGSSLPEGNIWPGTFSVS